MRRLLVVLGAAVVSVGAAGVTPTSFLSDGATALNSLKGPFAALVVALLVISVIGAVVHAVVGAIRNG